MVRVKSGNFGHQVNSDIHLQTVKSRVRRLLMSRLIWILHCLLSLFIFYSSNPNMKQTLSLYEFSRPSEFTRLYIKGFYSGYLQTDTFANNEDLGLHCLES